jgi:hypothetical protein
MDDALVEVLGMAADYGCVPGEGYTRPHVTVTVPLDVGRSSYAVSGGLFRAVTARDGGCSIPGCGRPPAWCHAHHVVHWANGGATALGNLTMLCSHDPRVVHHRGWQVHIGIDGHPWFTPPPWIDPERQPRSAYTRKPWPELPAVPAHPGTHQLVDAG